MYPIVDKYKIFPANKRKQEYVSIRSHGTTMQSRWGLVGRATQNTGYFWRLCVYDLVMQVWFCSISFSFSSVLTSYPKGDDRWLEFAKRLASGRYNDMSALLGLLEAVMKIEERKIKGLGLRNMKYPEEFDYFCTTMAAISPAAYRAFRAAFSGRSLNSMA